MRTSAAKLATCSPCGVDLGAGDCWDCHDVRTKLELLGLIKHPIYNKLQWKASEDKLLRDGVLAETKRALSEDEGS